MAVKDISSRASVLLDLLRWGSASLVLLTHINNRMFVSYAEALPENRDLALLAWTFVTGFGHPAVVIFFVMSGFLVGGPVLEAAINRAEIDLRKYFIDRFARIYLVLLPVIFITFLADFIGSSVSPQVYASIPAEHWSAWALVGTVLNVQNFLSPFFGSNGPLGTLANEWWYYLTAPLLILAWLRRSPIFLLGGAIAIAITAYFATIWPWHGVGFVVWLAGAASYCLRRPAIANKPAAIALFLLAYVGARLFINSSQLQDFFVSTTVDFVQALAAINLIMVFRGDRGPCPSWILRTAKGLADYSYSLYAVHVPLIMVIVAFAAAHLGLGHESQPSSARILGAIAIACVVSLFSWLLARNTERHTGKVRRFLYARGSGPISGPMQS